MTDPAHRNGWTKYHTFDRPTNFNGTVEGVGTAVTDRPGSGPITTPPPKATKVYTAGGEVNKVFTLDTEDNPDLLEEHEEIYQECRLILRTNSEIIDAKFPSGYVILPSGKEIWETGMSFYTRLLEENRPTIGRTVQSIKRLRGDINRMIDKGSEWDPAREAVNRVEPINKERALEEYKLEKEKTRSGMCNQTEFKDLIVEIRESIAKEFDGFQNQITEMMRNMQLQKPSTTQTSKTGDTNRNDYDYKRIFEDLTALINERQPTTNDDELLKMVQSMEAREDGIQRNNQADIDEANNKAALLEKENTELKKQAKGEMTLLKLMKAKDDGIEALRAENAELAGALADMDGVTAELDRLNAEIKDIESNDVPKVDTHQIATLEEKVKALEVDKEFIRVQMVSEATDNFKSQEAIALLKSNIAAIEKENAKLKLSVKAPEEQESEISRLKAELAGAKEQEARRERDDEANRDLVAQRETNQKKQLQRLKSELSALEEAKKDKDKTNASLEAEILLQRGREREAYLNLKTAGERIKELEEEIYQFENKPVAPDYSKELEKTQKENETIIAYTKDLLLELQLAQRTNAVAQKEIEFLKKETRANVQDEVKEMEVDEEAIETGEQMVGVEEEAPRGHGDMDVETDDKMETDDKIDDVIDPMDI